MQSALSQDGDELGVVTVALRQRGAAGEHDPGMTDVGASELHDLGMIDTMHAIEITETGGPEVLQYVDKPTPSPGPGEVLIKAEAIGINFIDTYFRSGLYKRELPFIVGIEVCGTIEAVGDDVAALGVGDRVVTAQAQRLLRRILHGASRFRAPTCPTAWLPTWPQPSLLKGMTAHYLLKSVYPVQQGDTVLVHAGAGGVGLILTQWATSLAVRVITTVSTPEKAELSRQAGAVEVLDYPDDPAEFGAKIKDLTDGGVAAVYDGVGAATFEASLASLAVRGTLALFGASSGPVPAFDPQRLNAAGSLFLTRPSWPTTPARPMNSLGAQENCSTRSPRAPST